MSPLSMPDFAGRLAESVAKARTLEELVRPLLELLQAVTGLESTYLTTIDTAAGYQYILFSRNTSRLDIPEGLSVPWEGTLCKRALEEGRPYTDDVANCWADSGPARELGIATYASTPVQLDDGTLYGTLCAASGERQPLAEGAAQVLQMFSRLIGQQIDRERMLQALQHANNTLAVSALTDATTGLPNRRALMEELRRRLGAHGPNGHALVVAFIDLDQFKAINDRHGHQAGDQVLKFFADSARCVLGADALLARIGGEEFAALLSGQDARRATVLGAAVAQHFAVRVAEREEGMGIPATVSVGLAQFDDKVPPLADALAAADRALYRAKALGGNRVELALPEASPVSC